MRALRRLGWVATLIALLALIVSPPAAATLLADSTDQLPAQQDDPEPKGSTAQAEPWWVEWLAVFDLNGNLIDDEAEEIADAAIQAGTPEQLIPVLVSFNEFPSEAQVVALLARVGAGPDAYTFRTQPMVDLDVPARNLLDLAAEPGVVAVEYDYLLYPLLDVSAPATQANRYLGEEPGNDVYNGLTAEDLGYTGSDMVVAVLDTGVQQQHSAFDMKWLAGVNVSVAIPPSPLCVDPVDDDGHGTHVASTAVGAQPFDGLFGTAKDAKLVEVKISAGPASLGGAERGFEFVKLYNDALESGTPYCGPDDEPIDVATLSFGSVDRGGPTAGSAEGFIDDLVASGVAVTIAVGNCGPSPSATCFFGDDDNGISSPGNAAGAIGVANFNDGGTVNRDNDVIAASSSRGPNSADTDSDSAAGGATEASNLEDRHRKPDVAAPGTSIQAAGPVPFTLSTKSGTSMATPHVAGIAALLLQAGEQASAETGGNLMASTGNGFSDNDYVAGVYPVRDSIIHSTDYKEAGAKDLWTGPNSVGLDWNNAWGYGQINAFDALCWAWANVLEPGGATPPVKVAESCGLTPPPPPPPPNPCELPGVTFEDPEGDHTTVLEDTTVVGGNEHDILSVSGAGLFLGSPDTLIFTMEVADLSSSPLPPNTTWRIPFIPPGGTTYFVDMGTDELGTVSFSYGFLDGNIFRTQGEADAGSFTPDGIIEITIDSSKVGAPGPGAFITDLEGRTERLVGPTAVGGLLVVIDSASGGAFALGSCFTGAPVARDDSALTEENSPVTIDVLANDLDGGNPPITVSTVSDPGHGTATDNGGVTVTYSPDLNFSGADSFEYTITNGIGETSTATVTVEVTPFCPYVPTGSFFDDFEPGPEAGWETNNGNGALFGVPVISVLDWTQVTDPFAHSPFNSFFSEAETVLKDDRLIAPAQPLSTDSHLVFWHRFAFEPDFDGGVLEVSTDGGATWQDVLDAGGVFVQGGYNGTIEVNPDSAISGREAWTGFSGSDTSMSRVEVDLGALGSTEVTSVLVRWRLATDFIVGDTGWWIDDVAFTSLVELSDCNRPPIARDDSVTTTVNSSVIIDVLANDVDPDGNPVEVTGITQPPAHGDATINADDTITYQPATDFVGADSFIYEVGDGEGGFDTAIVSIEVTEVPNQSPDAADDSTTVAKNGSEKIKVLVNDNDPDGDPLNVIDVTDPLNGTATINPNNTITYEPEAGFTGSDSFDYSISDGRGGTDTATVSVAVNNDPPQARKDTTVTQKDTPVTIPVLNNDSDPNGDPLTASDITDSPDNGTAVINPDNTITYTPAAGFTGTDNFEYEVCDDDGACDTARVTVVVRKSRD